MIPVVTVLRLTGSAHRAELPLLVLGPGAGAARDLAPCAALLADAFDVVAWDPPGRGYNRALPEEPFDDAELAAGVLAVVDDLLEQRGGRGEPFVHAGSGLGARIGALLGERATPTLDLGDLDPAERPGDAAAAIRTALDADDAPDVDPETEPQPETDPRDLAVAALAVALHAADDAARTTTTERLGALGSTGAEVRALEAAIRRELDPEK